MKKRFTLLTLIVFLSLGTFSVFAQNEPENTLPNKEVTEETPNADDEQTNEENQENDLETRKQIGYLPESAPSYDEMLVGEFLNFVVDLT